MVHGCCWSAFWPFSVPEELVHSVWSGGPHSESMYGCGSSIFKLRSGIDRAWNTPDGSLMAIKAKLWWENRTGEQEIWGTDRRWFTFEKWIPGSHCCRHEEITLGWASISHRVFKFSSGEGPGLPSGKSLKFLLSCSSYLFLLGELLSTKKNNSFMTGKGGRATEVPRTLS